MSGTNGWGERLIIKALAWLLVLMGIGWAALVLWIDGPSNPWLGAILSTAFSAGCLLVLVLFRPFSRAVLLVVAWWSQIAPRNDRDRTHDVVRLSRAWIVGSRITIENVRNFDYRSETDSIRSDGRHAPTTWNGSADSTCLPLLKSRFLSLKADFYH